MILSVLVVFATACLFVGLLGLLLEFLTPSAEPRSTPEDVP